MGGAVGASGRVEIRTYLLWPLHSTTSPKAMFLSTCVRPALVATVRVWPAPAGWGSMATAQLPSAAAVATHGPTAAAAAFRSPPPDRLTVTTSPGAALSPNTAAFVGPRCSTMFESKKWGSSAGATMQGPPVHVTVIVMGSSSCMLRSLFWKWNTSWPAPGATNAINTISRYNHSTISKS